MTGRQRRVRFLVPVLGAAAAALLAACGSAAGAGSGGSAGSAGGASSATTTRVSHRVSVTASTTTTRPRPRPPAFPHLLAVGTRLSPTDFVPAVVWRGQTAAWVARRADIGVLSFNQRLVELHLHSGTVDAGTTGWRWGSELAGSERRRAVAAFNGGFKLAVGAGGFASGGRVASPLRTGLGSIVTYASGVTDIGAWGHGVPAAGQRVVSVRQNLPLLIDGGHPAANLGCLLCWGATLGGVSDPARSALGITADGHLIWVGGEHLTVSELADALLGARVVRAVELDINPEWVAGYLYGHHGRRGVPAPAQVVPGQPGVPGQFLAPYARDFFVVAAR